MQTSNVDSDTLKALLANKGIAFQTGAEIASGRSPANILGEQSFTIDDTVWRAVAKIAFNYLAYWQGLEFARHPAFDPAEPLPSEDAAFYPC